MSNLNKLFYITTENISTFSDIISGKLNGTDKYTDIINQRNIMINSTDIGGGKIIRYFSGTNVCVRGSCSAKKIYLSLSDMITHYIHIHKSDPISHLPSRVVYNKIVELGFTYPGLGELCANSMHHCDICLGVALSRTRSNKARKCDKLIVSNYESAGNIIISSCNTTPIPTSSPAQYQPPQTQPLHVIENVIQFQVFDVSGSDDLPEPPLYRYLDKLTVVVTDVTTAAMGIDTLSLTSAELLCTANLPLIPMYATADYMFVMGLFTNTDIPTTGTCYIILCVATSAIMPSHHLYDSTPELQHAVPLDEFNENYQ